MQKVASSNLVFRSVNAVSELSGTAFIVFGTTVRQRRKPPDLKVYIGRGDAWYYLAINVPLPVIVTQS